MRQQRAMEFSALQGTGNQNNNIAPRNRRALQSFNQMYLLMMFSICTKNPKSHWSLARMTPAALLKGDGLITLIPTQTLLCCCRTSTFKDPPPPPLVIIWQTPGKCCYLPGRHKGEVVYGTAENPLLPCVVFIPGTNRKSLWLFGFSV